jgi:hypothetical protein
MITSILLSAALESPVSSGLALPETLADDSAITSVEVLAISSNNAAQRSSAIPGLASQEGAQEDESR